MADKARLEAAPDENKPGIVRAMHDEKKKAMQEADAQQNAEEAKKHQEGKNVEAPRQMPLRRSSNDF